MHSSVPATGPAKPLIGIVSGMVVVEAGIFPGIERSAVNHDYVTAVEAAGGIPVLIPVVEDDGTVRRQVDAVDALLMTGGYDPSPLLYGESPSRRLDFIFPEMDRHQMAAIRFADELGKPLFGICRGLQMLNIAFGGTLYQDLSLVPNSFIQHFQKSRKHSQGHQVNLVRDTLLADIFGEATILTNSFHHLAIKDTAPGFIVNASAPDGVIEGIERSGGTPVLAVQWHPEMMYEKHSEMLAVFVRFIEMAKEGMTRRS